MARLGVDPRICLPYCKVAFLCTLVSEFTTEKYDDPQCFEFELFSPQVMINQYPIQGSRYSAVMQYLLYSCSSDIHNM
jgi:hypothetical protein